MHDKLPHFVGTAPRDGVDRPSFSLNRLPATGFLRCKQIIGDPTADPPIPAIVPVARSTWLQGVRDGRFPQPVRLGRRITVWRCEDIRKLVEQAAEV